MHLCAANCCEDTNSSMDGVSGVKCVTCHRRGVDLIRFRDLIMLFQNNSRFNDVLKDALNP